MVNESSEQPSKIESHTHTQDSPSERLPHDLVKGNLLYRSIDGTSIIHDGTFQGIPIVIKEAGETRTIPMVQKEHDFLLHPPIQPIEASLQEYGIPSDWGVQTRFVRLMDKAVTPAMYKQGITVLEKAQGKSLREKESYKTDNTIPYKFHLGALMGYIDMMRKLAKKDVALDSNIDTDLFVLPDIVNKKINVVRIDCMPTADRATALSVMQSPNTEYWLHKGRRNLTYEQLTTDQVIDAANSLYPNNPTWSFLGATIPALSGRFKEGDIYDSETLFDRLKNGLKRAKWDDTYVREADNHRLQKWVGASF